MVKLSAHKKIVDLFSKDNLIYFDWFIFFLLAAVCFFTFQHGDINHTAMSSFAYLKGYFLSFYEYNAQYLGANNYLPSTYILFAIWNIPMYLLGIVTDSVLPMPRIAIFWNKIFTSIFYFATAYLIYKTALEIGFAKRKAQLTGFLFITTPIAFFSQFIFGQYDILTTFFIMLGLLNYYKNKNLWFVLAFGVAVTFKYFALLFFIPLLFLKEKRIPHLIKALLIFIIPIAIEYLIYRNSPAFISGVLGFHAVNYFTSLKLSLSYYSIYLVYFAFICILAVAYFKVVEEKSDIIKWSLFLLSGVVFIAYGLSTWHPQWLLIGMPILVLSTMINKRSETFLYIDIILMYAFVVLTVFIWPKNVDTNLFYYGILPNFFNINFDFMSMQSNPIYYKDINFMATIFSAGLFVHFIFKHPKYCLTDFAEKIKISRTVIYLRFILGVSLFIIPAYYALYESQQKVVVFNLSEHEVNYPSNGIEKLEKKDGKLFVKATTNDAYFILPNIDLGKNNRIVLKAHGEGTNFQVYYLTNNTEYYTEANSVGFNTAVPGGIVNLRLPNGATGKALRIDVGDTQGEYIVEKLYVLSSK